MATRKAAARTAAKPAAKKKGKRGPQSCLQS